MTGSGRWEAALTAWGGPTANAADDCCSSLAVSRAADCVACKLYIHMIIMPKHTCKSSVFEPAGCD